MNFAKYKHVELAKTVFGLTVENLVIRRRFLRPSGTVHRFGYLRELEHIASSLSLLLMQCCFTFPGLE